MQPPFNRQYVLKALEELKGLDPERTVFGAIGHQYRLRPPLPKAAIEVFEGRYGVTLPADYRYFLTEIGDGGAGPYYGVFPFGQDDYGDDGSPWEVSDLVGDVSKPFPHADAWNLSDSFWADPPDPPPGTSPEEADELEEAWRDKLDEKYYDASLVNGAIPICQQGCALRLWLVISGEQSGYVWHDDRADYKGVHPVTDPNGNHLTFSAWYLAWLLEALREVNLASSVESNPPTPRSRPGGTVAARLTSWLSRLTARDRR